MQHRCYLSVAGITILLETDHPLYRNKEFEPFIIEETAPDIHAVIRKAETLPPISENVIFTDQCYRIAKDERGNFRKFFFEKPTDPVCCTVASYDLANGRIDAEYLDSYSRCVSEVRNCFYLLGFEAILLQRNKLCLHASCVDTSMGGLLFSGVSGIGKSTQAELWCRYRGARQINGDRPILSCDERGWTAWGSPYAGSSRCHVNDSCTVSAIILLKQADRCSLRRLGRAEAFRGVWAGMTVRSWDASFVDTASLLTIDLVTKVPVFEYSCTPDEGAVAYLEQALRKDFLICENPEQ